MKLVKAAGHYFHVSHIGPERPFTVSRHGIPDTVVLDNGSQFSSQEFHEFSLSWELNHVTSSPHDPKSNGKAESSVKIVKQLFEKAERDRKDPWLALLDYRNTPTEGVGPCRN